MKSILSNTPYFSSNDNLYQLEVVNVYAIGKRNKMWLIGVIMLAHNAPQANSSGHGSHTATHGDVTLPIS